MSQCLTRRAPVRVPAEGPRVRRKAGKRAGAAVGTSLVPAPGRQSLCKCVPGKPEGLTPRGSVLLSSVSLGTEKGWLSRGSLPGLVHLTTGDSRPEEQDRVPQGQKRAVLGWEHQNPDRGGRFLSYALKRKTNKKVTHLSSTVYLSVQVSHSV